MAEDIEFERYGDISISVVSHVVANAIQFDSSLFLLHFGTTFVAIFELPLKSRYPLFANKVWLVHSHF